MLSQNIFRAVKYAALIALILIPLRQAESAKLQKIFQTDTPSYQLYYFWDLRDRDSFFQVSNNGSSTILLHVQIFNANDGCSEIDFIDTYTPFDAHIYDMSNLSKNDGGTIGAAGPEEGDFGFVAVTVIDEDGAVRRTPVLTGNFRIFDKPGGYEYGAKAAGYPSASIQITSTYQFNFNGIRGTNQADVVGIAVQGAGTASVLASPAINAVFDPLIFDLDENALSCATVTFACDATHFDYGINSGFGNSKGGLNICPGEIGDGKVYLKTSSSNANFFVGFIGINNSEGSGNMSTFWALPFRRFTGFLTTEP